MRPALTSLSIFRPPCLLIPHVVPPHTQNECFFIRQKLLIGRTGDPQFVCVRLNPTQTDLRALLNHFARFSSELKPASMGMRRRYRFRDMWSSVHPVLLV